ncbi:hypothetical protein KP509_06G080200 [Ceratopteris richardii]|uniref:C2H2-type domain-containing protein n=1 Tax=Ceratopteris richardii TaxID=49495 RepID=A0A8T2UPJ7_CERRI|nr:hypothetical protein KP509_06G080200 [Ceratopteris richardii]
MEEIPASIPCEDFVDVASIKILDLRTLGQDEIRCLARLCGDVPSRIQDIVNVVVDKSIFNESAGSRRQTFDRDRIPRNKDRRLSTVSATAQLHLAMESQGLPHKELILHLCRQLKIESGDRALYQPQMLQSSGVLAEGNRPMSLKRMARASASFAGRAQVEAIPIPKTEGNETTSNGKELTMTNLHRSGKKLRTKDEARRKAAESQAQALVTSQLQENKRVLLSAKLTSFEDNAKYLHEGMPPASLGSAVLDQNGLLSSPETATVGGSGPSQETQKPPSLQIAIESVSRMGNTKKKAFVSSKNLRCSCGNAYGSLYTLRRHAKRTGHTFVAPQRRVIRATATAGKQHEISAIGAEVQVAVGRRPRKKNIGVLLSERHPWKRAVKHYSCRHCKQQFVRKKLFLRHVKRHLRKGKKRVGKSGPKSIGGKLGNLKGEVKTSRDKLLRPHKKVEIGNNTLREKRKHETEALDRQVRPCKSEENFQKVQLLEKVVLPCQECGKIFDNFARYTGHLSMHAKLRKVSIPEASMHPFTWLKKKKFNSIDVSSLGIRSLLRGSSGTHLSGLPAKLLFSDSGCAIE